MMAGHHYDRATIYAEQRSVGQQMSRIVYGESQGMLSSQYVPSTLYMSSDSMS